MRKRIRISIVITLALVLLGLFFFPIRKQLRSDVTDGADTPLVETDNAEHGSETNPRDGGYTSNSTDWAQSEDSPHRLNQVDAALADKNVGIHFWGRVVDQDGNPLSGVRIVMKARTWQAVPEIRATHPKAEVFSDDNGQFEIEGLTGDILSREAVEKEGYHLSPQAPVSFHYGQSPRPFSPNPNEPVVFRMWRADPAEGLISLRKLWGVVPDGRSYYTFDLINGTKHEGTHPDGDFRVRLTRQASIQPRERFYWKLELEALEGGLVEARDEFHYRAPQVGYVESIKVEMDPNNDNWTPVLKREYYLTSRSGRVYAIVRFEVISNYSEQSAISIEAVINPQGSHNLEP